MKRQSLIAIFLMVLLPLYAMAADKSADQLLGELRAIFVGAEDLTARFVQTTTLEAVGIDKVSGGDLTLKRGGKMRWRYEGEDPQQIISDGRTLWMYQERDRTVIRHDIGELTPAGALALDLLGSLDRVEEHFALTACGPDCLELTPLSPDPNLALVRVEMTGDKLGAMTTKDQVGNLTRVEFSELKLNSGAEDSLFDFTVPGGVDIFDSQGNAQ